MSSTPENKTKSGAESVPGELAFSSGSYSPLRVTLPPQSGAPSVKPLQKSLQSLAASVGETMSLIATFVIFAVLGSAGAALASSTFDPASEIDWSLLAQPVLDAVAAGNYPAAAAFVLVMIVAAVRYFGARRVPWLETRAAGSLLTLVGGFGAALGAALLSAELSTALALDALRVAVVAAGGYSLLKPIVLYLRDHGPAWLKPAVRLVSWWYEKPSRASTEGDTARSGVVKRPMP